MYIAFCDICADGFATLAQFEGIYSNLVGKPIADGKEYAGLLLLLLLLMMMMLLLLLLLLLLDNILVSYIIKVPL